MNECTAFLDAWSVDPNNVKPAFVELKACLEGCGQTTLSFKARPGISYSLRGNLGDTNGLFAMVDVVDDDPEARWLSVCFYDGQITDPQELGDWVPEGLNGQDARCFDIDEGDPERVAYVAGRIKEARKNAETA